MTDNEIINIGDVCTYSYLDKNKSLSIVEVVKELSDEVVVVKFHQVINDDSGNGFFVYLLDKGKIMNVSKKYLTKIDLINRQKADIERLETEIENLESIQEISPEAKYLVDTKADKVISLLNKVIKSQEQIEAEAVKEFAKYLIDRAEQSEISVGDIPDLVVDFQNRTQEDASIGSQPEWKQAMLRTFLGRGL